MLLVAFVVLSSFHVAYGKNMSQDLEIAWGDGRAKLLGGGELLTLSLDKNSGSGFNSKKEFLFAKIDVQIKLVAGNSAGTVTAYYMSSKKGDPGHDEIDFEFLGNLSGEPYTIHTNVFVQGKGNKEQQFQLWFDPTADFHTYSILWNPLNIIFLVDGTPIRVFKNAESHGVPFPKSKPMKVHSSIWHADDWATRGGLVKTDWSKAPFVASYRNFYASSSSTTTEEWMKQSLSKADLGKLEDVQKKYMIYNYCTDKKRFPGGYPSECTMA